MWNTDEFDPDNIVHKYFFRPLSKSSSHLSSIIQDTSNTKKL